MTLPVTTPAQWVRFIYEITPQDVGPSVVSLWDRQTKGSVHLAVPNDKTSEDAFNQIVNDGVAQGKDVYFGVALRRTHLLPTQRGKVQDCRGLPGLFLDIDLDRGYGTHAAKNLPTTDAQAAEILTALPDPTCIIDSGHGWHVYWLFDNVHPIGYTDEPGLSRASEQFQRKAIAQANSLGYHVDSTHNLDRVLRVPFTLNTKAGLNLPVTVLFHDGPRYGSLNALMEAAGIDARTQLPASTVTPSKALDIDPDLLKPREEHAKAQSTEWIKESLGKLQNQDSKDLMELVLQGKPFAVPGARDQTLQRVASIVAYLAPDRDPGEIALEVLSDSLSTFDDVDKGKYTQADRIEWATEKIARAQDDARRDRVERERLDQALKNILLTQARAAPRRDQRLGPCPGGAYTDAEIAQFAAQQNAQPQNFQKRWIIQKGQSFYIYINGDYQIPLSYPELDVSLPRDLAPAVANGYVRLDCLSAKGEPRSKTTKEILGDYASVARSVVAHLDLGYSYYDESTQTFYEATCPIRPLAPAYHPEVDHWLNLLGNQKAKELLDWVATVTNLNKQSSGLYLQGPPGTGKSMLSQGLARLWHMGGPTELVRVLGDWVHDIARCPLIVADEQIPAGFKGQRTSAELRSLIGSSSRTLTRKFRDNADLVGATRLILSANNADMLVFDESLSQSDLEAVAGRFLHIQGDDRAKTYLQSIDTTGWVDDDIIAKHALWLRDNRTVTPGKRFLVEGSAKEVSKMLATRGGVAGRVAEWLVRHLCDPKQAVGPKQADLCRIGNGKYLVNTNAVVQFWEAYIKTGYAPGTPAIGQALRNLSVDQVRAGTKRYFEIDIEAINHWSENNLIGSPDLIMQKIAEALPVEKDPDAGI